MSFPNPDNYAQDCDCNPDSAALAPTAINDQLSSLQSQISANNANDVVQAGQISTQAGQISTQAGQISTQAGQITSLQSLESIMRIYNIPPANFNIARGVDYFPPWGTGDFLSATPGNIAYMPSVVTPYILTYGTETVSESFFYAKGNYNLFQADQGYLGAPARIMIISAGFYRFSFQFYGYDLKNDNRLILKLWRWDAVNNPSSTSAMVVSKKRFSGAIPFDRDDGDSFEASIIIPVRVNAVYPAYAFSLLSPDVAPYTNRTYSISWAIPTFTMSIEKVRNP